MYNIVNVLNELFSIKGLILCFVNVTSLKKHRYINRVRVSAPFVPAEKTEHSRLPLPLTRDFIWKVTYCPAPLELGFLICKKMKLDLVTSRVPFS